MEYTHVGPVMSTFYLCSVSFTPSDSERNGEKKQLYTLRNLRGVHQSCNTLPDPTWLLGTIILFLDLARFDRYPNIKNNNVRSWYFEEVSFPIELTQVVFESIGADFGHLMSIQFWGFVGGFLKWRYPGFSTKSTIHFWVPPF